MTFLSGMEENLMKSRNAFRGHHVLAIIVIGVVLIALLAVQSTAQAPPPPQPGWNAVWGSSATLPVGAVSFYDATAYVSYGDICQILHEILSLSASQVAKANWVVIDARGIVPSGSTQLCGSNPWNSLPTVGRPWTTVLLPAGTIIIATEWVLPQYTRIVGEGPGVTTLLACQKTTSGCDMNNFSSSAMIQMGAASGSASCPGFCFSIGAENLTLDAGMDQTAVFDGIDNSWAEEMSYVRHVAMLNITGIGLSLGTTATIPPGNNGTSSHSGPYSDISIAVANSSAECINIAPNAQPRGIHGINCTSSGGNTNAGIYLDGGNVSVEDAFISGFKDGIEIGSQGQVQGDVLFNITGGTLTNVVHIAATNDLPPFSVHVRIRQLSAAPSPV
jgi:hypothetical protein